MGTQSMHGLMVASQLSDTGIRSYVFDPPGDDELWSGDPEELQELLSQSPEERHWMPGRWLPPTAPPPGDGSAAADDPSTEDGEQVLGTPPPYQIPADERPWFTQVLSSTTAAAR